MRTKLIAIYEFVEIYEWIESMHIVKSCRRHVRMRSPRPNWCTIIFHVKIISLELSTRPLCISFDEIKLIFQRLLQRQVNREQREKKKHTANTKVHFAIARKTFVGIVQLASNRRMDRRRNSVFAMCVQSDKLHLLHFHFARSLVTWKV